MKHFGRLEKTWCPLFLNQIFFFMVLFLTCCKLNARYLFLHRYQWEKLPQTLTRGFLVKTPTEGIWLVPHVLSSWEGFLPSIVLPQWIWKILFFKNNSSYKTTIPFGCCNSSDFFNSELTFVLYCNKYYLTYKQTNLLKYIRTLSLFSPQISKR